MILTNRFNVTYDYEKIDRDYDIFQVEKPGYLDKTNILDLVTQQFQARAVQYSFGRTALVLFDKNDISEKQFRNAIKADYPDATVKKVDILNEESRGKCFYYKDRLLLQLLVNSIRVPRMEGFSYNNLTGKLFYGNPDWVSRDRQTKQPYSMYFLQISFDPGMYLNLDVKTFRKHVFCRNGRYYLLDPNTGYFRRKLKEDNVRQEDLFAEASFGGKHNTVEYLDFSSFEKFRKCKLGVMEQFLQDVRKYLGEYVTLTAEERIGDQCYKESKKEKENLSGVDYAVILNQLGVNIVDLCKTEESEQIVHRLVSELQHFYGITPQLGELQKDMYNIRLIHVPEYYEEHQLPDPHSEDLHGCIVQHMTQEDHTDLMEPMGDKESPVIHKILVELILKGDVRSGQISIYNWEKLSSNKIWTFVQRRKIKAPDGGFESMPNAAEKATKNRFSYTTVRITPDGKMDFRSFDDMEIASDEFEERIRYVFDTYEFKQWRGGKEVEGLVFSDINNIHVIIRTKEKTMPNTSAIWSGLKNTNVRDAVARELVLDALQAYKDFYLDDNVYAEQLAGAVDELPATLTKGELKKLMNMRTKAGKRFNRFLHNEYGIWISPEIKDSDFSADYLLENVTDIKYFMDENTDGEGITSFNYYVGPEKSNLQLSIHNASIVRQVQAEEGVEFQELLPLMAVDFVRIGSYTVLPFPFKYLREYCSFAASAGNTSAETIRKYIASQG